MRAVALADPKVQVMVKKQFVPLKLAFDKEKGFPVEWPALKSWAERFKFADGRGFTGCSVVSPDLEAEYGTTGAPMVWEMFDSGADDAAKFHAFLSAAAARAHEERVLRTQRGVTKSERTAEIVRFRKGLDRAVEVNGRFQLPPKGFSVEKVMALFDGDRR